MCISDGSNIPYMTPSSASPALAFVLAAHQRGSNKDKDDDQSNDDAAKDNFTCADDVFSFLSWFAAELYATIAKAGRTRNRLVFDHDGPENGSRC